MSNMYLALVDDELGTFELSPANGILVEEFEPSFPEVRASTYDRPDANGIIDDTQFFGARVVTISGKWIPVAGITRTQVRQSILKYLVPWRRPRLRWQQDPADQLIYETTVRVDRGDFKILSVVDDFNFSLKVDPLWSDSNVKTSIAPYTAGVPLGGDNWPWIGPGASTPGYIDFPDGVASSGVLQNDGLAPAYPVVVITGHAPNPTITHGSTGKVLSFSGLNVLDGQSLRIDMNARTAVLDNTYNVFNSIDFSVSDWWTVQPGSQYVLMSTSPAPSGALPTAQFFWQDLYL